mgnify:CR=1 FL=1
MENFTFYAPTYFAFGKDNVLAAVVYCSIMAEVLSFVPDFWIVLRNLWTEKGFLM